jgi:hypothetical protein
MRKMAKSTIVLLALVLMLSTALAYSLWLYTMQNQMRITTYKEIQCEYPLGNKITSFDWGDFNKSSPTKTEVFYLRSFSNTNVNVTWNVSGLDPAFAFGLNVTQFEFIAYNQAIPFEATLNLTDFSKTPGCYTFELSFGE